MAALLIAGCGGGSAHRTTQSTTSTSTPFSTTTTAVTPGPLVGIHKIQHVVIIMQENRSFDSYFGTYPGADGYPMNDGQIDVCLPDPKTGTCVRPYHDRQDMQLGGPHSTTNAVVDVDDGKMDGFIKEQQSGQVSCVEAFNPACGYSGGTPDVMGYHDGADIPNYWAYARDFVLQDHMFESVESWSLPAHLYMVSEWSAYCSKKGDPMSCRNATAHPQDPPDFGRPTDDPGPAPNYAWTDLTWLLHRDQVSWAYYVFQGSEPDCDDNAAMSCAPVGQNAKTPGIWNPLPYFTDVQEDDQLGNIQSLTNFFAAAKSGALPAVSWIVPNGTVSEHPPALVTVGQTYVTGLINAIMRSPDWDSTAIFLAWDDWGGFYDGVDPPQVDQNGYGLRVPGLVISPYAKQGYIDHQTLSFDAYVKFIEDDFLDGQRLDPATDGRPDPRPDVREDEPILGDLVNDFDFNQPPRAPVILPVDPVTDLIMPSVGSSFGRGGSRALSSAQISAAASYLGISATRLRRQLESGKTLSQIAREYGATVGELRRAIARRERSLRRGR